MPSILLSGLPANAKLSFVVFLFKRLFSKHNIVSFWITDQADIRGTDLKSATISFESPVDAEVAVGILDGFLFRSGKELFPLSAQLEESRPHRSPSPYRQRSPSPYSHRRYEYDARRSPRERRRSRSPLYEEASKLDLEIELLKKKRLIIEEERRLLLESKKLELIKEYGHDAVAGIDSYEDDLNPRRSRDFDRRRGDYDRRKDEFGRRKGEFDRRKDEFDRHRKDEFDRHRKDDYDRRKDDYDRRQDDYGRRRDVERRRDDRDRREHRWRRTSQNRNPASRSKPGPPIVREINMKHMKRLPKFRNPCARIIKEMSEVIEKHEPEDVLVQEKINSWLKISLRQRLTTLLADTTRIVSFVEICELYRKNYPKDTDEEFVKKVIQDVEMSHMDYNDKSDSENCEITKASDKVASEMDVDGEENLSDVKDKATESSEVEDKPLESAKTEEVEQSKGNETKPNIEEKNEEEPTLETNNKEETGNEDPKVNDNEIIAENTSAEVANEVDVSEIEPNGKANEGEKELNDLSKNEKKGVVSDISKNESTANVNKAQDIPIEASTESKNNNSEWVEGTVDWN